VSANPICVYRVISRSSFASRNHGLVHHSDRGSQYASGDYQAVLAAAGIVCSMSRRGNCWDNAVAESFVATLKVELVHEASWVTRQAARAEALRVHRGLLQRAAAPFVARISQFAGL
jgi:transposase InsO family protein